MVGAGRAARAAAATTARIRLETRRMGARLRLRLLGDPPAEFRALVRDRAFSIVDEKPDVIVAYGGDGAVIGAERSHPGVPKLGVRRNDACVKCERHEDGEVLRRLARGELKIEPLAKLDARCGKKRFVAMNDVIFRNADPRSAVRFVVALNGKIVTEEVIGDGLVVATPFGSSAYFRSITHLTFRSGIGVAFNNCTDFQPHLVADEKDVVSITVSRGPATLTADNDPEQAPIGTGDVLVVKRAAKPARLVHPDTLRCADCRYKYAPRRRY
jgi:NAD+ kinase